MAVDGEGRIVLTDGSKNRVRVRRFDEAWTSMGNWNLVSTAGVAVTGIAVDGDDLVLVAGWFRGELELDGRVLISAGAEDMFFLLLDLDGNVVAFEGLGGPKGERPLRVALDVYGEFRVQGMVDIGRDGRMSLFTLGLGVNGEVLDLNMIDGPDGRPLEIGSGKSDTKIVLDEENPEGLIEGQTDEENPEGI